MMSCTQYLLSFLIFTPCQIFGQDVSESHLKCSSYKMEYEILERLREALHKLKSDKKILHRLRNESMRLRRELTRLKLQQYVENNKETTKLKVDPTPPPTRRCFSKADLVFVLDTSTSVGLYNYDVVKFLTKQILKNIIDFPEHVRVGVVSYSTSVTVEFYLNAYQTETDIFSAMDALPWRYGSTNTADALKTMRTVMFSRLNGDREDVPNVAIFITDGISNINYKRTTYEAKKDHEDGIHIFGIGFGLDDMSEVNAIASFPASKNAFDVRSIDQLKSVTNKIVGSDCPVEKKIEKGPLCMLRRQKGNDTYSKVYCDMEDWVENLLTNVAPHSVVYSSSLLNSTNEANFTVDDKVITKPAKECFISEKEDSPWLMLDLRKPSDVIFIVLVSRQDGFGEYLHDFHVTVGSNTTSFENTCETFQGPGETGQLLIIPCENAHGRYVKVQIVGNGTTENQLSLCEVSIYVMK